MMLLEELRRQAPLVICITNDVVKNFTANGLVALGASPAMSEQREDLEDLLRHASGLLINIGTVTEASWNLYREALAIAERYQVFTVLDPVACGASAYRRKVAFDLINHYKIDAIRGNAGEIAALIGKQVKMKGVDSSQVNTIETLAQQAAQQFNKVIIATGEIDAIATPNKVVTLHNGSVMMPKVIGTGCLLGAVLAGVATLSTGSVFENMITGLSAYNIAGELATESPLGHLPGSYQTAFLDALSQVDDDLVRERSRVCEVQS
ncbi:hydroxyethylthiazole kinase [Aerococcaceae bacterium NML190073]|nr:hydroxyethylthiazole kinase [Aerococcaceae bacterium NML190073]